MYNSTKQDHARIQLDKISRFGLMEMSRQRIKPALNDLMGKTVWVRSVSSICESIFRLITEKSINNRSSILLLKVSPNIANELLNRYRSNLDQIERKFSNKIMTFIDPYKQNDSYTIEVKKNAYFDYEKNMEESSKAFQNRTSYNLKVPKKRAKAMVEDVEFRNMPKADSNKKGLLDSLFTFFKGDEKPKVKKPRNRRYNASKSRPNTRRNMKSKRPRNISRKPSINNPPKAKSNVRNTPKKQSGNVKNIVKKPKEKVIDDNIGNRIEPTEKPTKRPVKRAKNDPRSGN